jgi:hypothetical protein
MTLVLGCHFGLQPNPSAPPPVDSADSGDADADSDADADADGDADADADADQSDKTGGRVKLSLLQIACPDCFGVTDSLLVNATAAFHEPTKKAWESWLPDVGDCVNDPTLADPADEFLDAGEWMYLQSGAVSIGLRSAAGQYDAEGLGESDFVRNAQYQLSVQGGDDLDAFNEDGALSTPEAISTLSPSDMLYINSRDAFAAKVPLSGVDIAWGPSGGSDSMVVGLDVYTQDGSREVGTTWCRGADDGALSIPAGSLSSYPVGGLVAIYVERWMEESFARPDNESNVNAFATFGVLGTGVISP